MRNLTTFDTSVTFEADEAVVRAVERYQQHREAARRCTDLGQHHLAEGHQELARRALREARRLAIGGAE